MCFTIGHRSMCSPCHDAAIRTTHTWSATHVQTRLPQDCRFTLPAAGVRCGSASEQDLKRQTLAERYENSVFRLTPCTVICLVATAARCFVKIAVMNHFRWQQASPIDGYSSSDAALSECCTTWYTWLCGCEAQWTSRCKMLARQYTLHLHMCPIIAH